MNKKLLFSVGVMFSGMLFSQKNYWKQVSNVDNRLPVFDKTAIPSKYKLYQLNVEEIKADLAKAPQRFSNDESLVLKFPTADGKLVDYVIKEASVMDPVLQAKYPNLRSYLGYEKGNSGNSIRFSVSPYDGMNVMYYNAGKTAYLDAYTQDKSTYMVYNREDLGANLEGFICGYKNPEGEDFSSEPVPQSLVQDGQFRNYRLALATTMEYSRYHINRAGLSAGTVAQKKETVLAAMNTTMTRVNGVYEKTISLTMTMIANNDVLLSIDVDAYGPGFTNTDGYALLDENQAFIDATIGSSAYDIGHIFSTGGGGVAQLRSPCTASKARGVTGRSAPRTDAFDIDYVAHEMGHQWGAQHTFDNSCDNNRSASTSVEPGSGSTIMAYAGICAPNIQSNSDAYFHVVSVNQMYSNITTGTGSGCAVKTANNNQVPVIQALTNYSIPYGTAFVLTGTATDPDGDALTYLWEQTNTRTSTTSTAPTATQTSGSVFRSYTPTASTSRYFPVMSAVAAGNLAPTWEVIPTVERDLNFSLFVNDNKATGNQAARANMIVTVTGTGPFKVTSQSAAANYNGGSSLAVTWDVAGTTAAPINTQNVQILLSSDNGLTYPTVLAESVPNTGTANVTLPNEDNSNARIMVKAVNNIYFAVNATRFNINKILAVNESAFEKGFAIYPNPAKGEVNISLNKAAKGATYQIVDLSGKLVSNGSLENEKTQVNISNLKTGTYRIVISNNGETTSKNLIVK
ncbi:reprolysin-like metallopeptidase [Epilithonimonas sp.]|uniref:zinc-dependent metalloprotease n=1 Tax=Epilithonimonas sp. TaxID=2894511 RepID=UPI00289F862C|nr:M12 family metallo-peptidase [Epilithonimonas sp.]